MLRVTVFLVLIIVTVKAQFRLFHTKYHTNHGDHTCLYRYASEFSGRARHLVPYCIRTPIDAQVEWPLPCYGSNMTFEELKRKNITGKQLMQWFAPVDLIADYEEFLISGSGGKELYCKCSQEDYSFGTRCHYQLAVNTTSFNNLVDATFAGKKFKRDARNLTEENDVTCYLLFNCTTYTGFCLDWRQVCDSKRDCVNGHDEERCLEKELNECDEKTEYRCLSGHCIPRIFSFDLTLDCPDWDDEQDLFEELYNGLRCTTMALANCEEHACTMSRYSCGDGQCSIDEITSYFMYTSCYNERNLLLVKRVYDFRAGLSKECWYRMVCQLGLSCLYESPNISNPACEKSILHGGANAAQFCYNLPSASGSCFVGMEGFFPTPSIAYPYVQVLYNWQQSVPYWQLKEKMICYNTSACNIKSQIFFNSSRVVQGYNCYDAKIFDNIPGLSSSDGIIDATVLLTTLQALFAHCIHSPSHSHLYRCRSGAQISPHRLTDGRVDCYLDYDDEFYTGNTCTYNLTDRFECLSISRSTIEPGSVTCKPRRLLHDRQQDCWNFEDEMFPVGCTSEYDCQFFRESDLSESFPFVYEELCNGIEFRVGSSKSEDETDCNAWPCQSRTHRCNEVWNRPNGCDEIDCPGLMRTYLSRVVANCSHDEHYCLRFNQSTLSCLSLARIGDGHIDCVIAMDEWRMANLTWLTDSTDISRQFPFRRCWNSTVEIGEPHYCDGNSNCPLNDDELLCPWHLKSSCSFQEFTCKNGTCLPRSKRCNKQIDCWPEAEDEWACDLITEKLVATYQSFSLTGFKTESREDNFESSTFTMDDQIQLKQEMIFINNSYFIFQCHRGIVLRSKDGNDVCICPPSYHGSRCQFQNERLSMTFRSEMPPIFDQNTIYHLTFVLFNHNYQVLSLETIFHMPSKQSVLKHFMYLIYPRHKNESLNNDLFVHIEAHTVTTTEVGTISLAWFYKVQFPFLPVNALSFKLDLEPLPLNETLCSRLGCIHGQCISYVNSRDKHFCSCNRGKTGFGCDQSLPVDLCSQLNCDAAYSKCVVYGDRAICLCTLGRIGHNCRVPYDACNGMNCQNNGKCVSLDDRTLPRVCLCQNDYFGDFCQFSTARLTIQIPRTAHFIPAIVAHFLHTPENAPGILSHRNTYFLKNIHPATEIIIQDRQQQFLPAVIILQTFVDLFSNYGSYYLLSLLNHNRTRLTKTLAFENRCIHVSERLNSTIMNFTWIKRVKLYHHYFKDVQCFFDEIYMCFVDSSQLIDCLNFNHKVAYCTDRNYCENGGRCLQNKQAGQIQFACVCPECHYGLFCQLTMMQYSLTLDSMLGQEILTDIPLDQQMIFIKILLGLVIVMIAIGIVSNICSTLTFSHVDIRATGCGYYLLILSIANQISLIVFVCRFIYLLVSQITIISNGKFLKISCLLFDFLLQLSISFCDWLSACVACERTVSVIKGVTFDRRRSVRVVKFVALALLICLILTSIHQVFNRELIPDPRSDDRLWCVVKFPTDWLQAYNAVMNLFNSIVPFLINIISSIVLLIAFSRTKQKSARKKYMTILKKQVQKHKDLIVSPVLMITFKLPMLIVILMIKCIKSKWQLYLSTACYFLSLVPLLATFAIFVLPAPSYVKIFNTERTKLTKRH